MTHDKSIFSLEKKKKNVGRPRSDQDPNQSDLGVVLD